VGSDVNGEKTPALDAGFSMLDLPTRPVATGQCRPRFNLSSRARRLRGADEGSGWGLLDMRLYPPTQIPRRRTPRNDNFSPGLGLPGTWYPFEGL